MSSDKAVTRILRVLQAAEPADRGGVTAQLLPLVYEELRRLARQYMAGERPGQTLQPTALVHEAYLRLISASGSGSELSWENRGHFFAAAGRAMRRILVERARRRQVKRRGGGRAQISLDDVEPPDRREDSGDVEPDPEVVLRLDSAVGRLEALDPRKARVVHLRYFAGLTIEQTAEAVGLSVASVKREWRFARAWLHGEMTRGDGGTAEGARR